MNKLNPFETARLIEGHLNQKLSEEDELRFQNHLKNDLNFEKIFANYRDKSELNSRINRLKNLDVDLALDEVKKKIAFKRKEDRKFSIIPYLKYAVVLFLIGFSVFFHQKIKDLKPVGSGKTIFYKSATDNQLSITLSNGEKVYPEAKNKIIKEDDGTQINVNQQAIFYQKQNYRLYNALNTLNVPNGKTYKITLSDGTNVWLNNASQLTFPVSFNGLKERLVTLKGEAYFEVKHDANTPFKVAVNGTQVQVLGTKFNINAFTAKETTATLLEGSIQIGTSKHNDVLKPNQQAKVKDGNITVGVADIKQAVAWKNGFLCFKQDELSTILTQIARWYNVDIKCDNINVSALHYTGSIAKNEKLEDVISMLDDITGLKFKLIGNTLIIKKSTK